MKIKDFTDIPDRIIQIGLTPDNHALITVLLMTVLLMTVLLMTVEFERCIVLNSVQYNLTIYPDWTSPNTFDLQIHELIYYTPNFHRIFKEIYPQGRPGICK